MRVLPGLLAALACATVARDASVLMAAGTMLLYACTSLRLAVTLAVSTAARLSSVATKAVTALLS